MTPVITKGQVLWLAGRRSRRRRRRTPICVRLDEATCWLPGVKTCRLGEFCMGEWYLAGIAWFEASCLKVDDSSESWHLALLLPHSQRPKSQKPPFSDAAQSYQLRIQWIALSIFLLTHSLIILFYLYFWLLGRRRTMSC